MLEPWECQYWQPKDEACPLSSHILLPSNYKYGRVSSVPHVVSAVTAEIVDSTVNKMSWTDQIEKNDWQKQLRNKK